MQTPIVSFKLPGSLWNHDHGMNAIAAIALAIFLFVHGVVHFIRPAYVQALVPAWVGQVRLLVFAGGLALVLDAALLLTPASRRVGGLAAAVMISVFAVAHLDALVRAMARRPRRLGRLTSAAAKVLLNACYVVWALTVAITAR